MWTVMEHSNINNEDYYDENKYNTLLLNNITTNIYLTGTALNN